MWLYRLNFDVLGWVMGRYWRLGLAGRADAIPRRGPILLTANHQSFMDPWFISMAFPRHVRYLITDTWYYRSKLWETVFDAYNGIPLDSATPGVTIDRICTRLEAGEVVGIFPEGRISHDGRLQEFRSGVARIASRTGVPVVALGIRGSFRSLPRTRRVPRPTRVTIHVDPPVTYAQVTGRSRPSKPGHAEFTDYLHRRTLDLSGELEAEVPAPAAPTLQAAVPRPSDDG
jgi:1-acyl-sn-glycerol-3-phosphate acyltransferase